MGPLAAILAFLAVPARAQLFDDEFERPEPELPKFEGLTGVLSIRLVPSKGCNLDLSEVALREISTFGTLQTIKQDSNDPKSFIPSWIGEYPTQLVVESENAKIVKKGLWKLYKDKESTCGDSTVQWMIEDQLTDDQVFTSIPLELFSGPVTRQKRPVELFSVSILPMEDAGYRLRSIGYKRVAPEEIRMRQKGNLERRAHLKSPYVEVLHVPTLHHHYIKPLSNGWTTTPQQIQDEKTAREELKKSNHVHFPQKYFSNTVDMLDSMASRWNILTTSKDGIQYQKLDGVLRQKGPPKDDAQRKAEQTQEAGIFGFLKRNWMLVLGGYLLVNMYFGSEEEVPPKVIAKK